MTGKVVFEESNISGSSFQINRNNLNSGIYFIELKGESRTFRGKLMIE